MELTASHAIQGLMLLVTIAGGYAVVKSQLSRVMQDLVKIGNELRTINGRLDTAESSTAVFQHQINVLSGILSPEALEKQHREIANLMARISVSESRIDRNASMHNGKHPHIKD
jgi:hypothetical protein|tara:strand:- start:2400 stop:2741 length:342 start_codon:yes stop_codon:yes gene_type:complete